MFEWDTSSRRAWATTANGKPNTSSPTSRTRPQWASYAPPPSAGIGNFGSSRVWSGSRFSLTTRNSEKPRPALQHRDGANRNTTNRLIGELPVPNVPDTGRHLHVVASPTRVLTAPTRVDVEELAAAINQVLAGQPLDDDTDLFVATAAVAYATGYEARSKEVA
jgi:hypothetical protein